MCSRNEAQDEYWERVRNPIPGPGESSKADKAAAAASFRTLFVKGDILVAQVDGRELRKGRRYVVALVEVDRTPVGSVTRYLVQDMDAPMGVGLAKAVPFWVTNAHLIMALA